MPSLAEFSDRTVDEHEALLLNDPVEQSKLLKQMLFNVKE